MAIIDYFSEDWDKRNADFSFAAGRDLTFDIEANGLLEPKLSVVGGELVIAPAADRMWMSCHIDEKTGECFDFIDDSCLRRFRRDIKRHNRINGRKNAKVFPLSLLPQFWAACDGMLTGHNSMKFDFMLVEKLIGYHHPRHLRWDTLIQSQTQNCDREYVFGSESGPHSVESWALRINKGTKVEHEDWLNFSVDMYHRCYRDVAIQSDIKKALEDEREVDRVNYNIDWSQALHTEMMAAFWIGYSEMWGFPLDQPFAKGLVEKFDSDTDAIEDELLPQMPFRINYERCGTKVNFEKYTEVMLKNTGLTRLPLGYCWPEDLGNKPQPIWKPFKANGEVAESVITFFHGKDAQPAKEAEPERFAAPAVLDENGKVIEKAVRARKARPAVPAKERIENCYEDDCGLTEKSECRFTSEDVAGPFTRIKWMNFDLGSNNQVIEFLTMHTSWEPTEFTEKGNPKLTEDSFDSIGDDGLGETLKTYLITKARRTTVLNYKDPSKGWLNRVRADGRVTPVNNTMGTPTARSRHANIVNVPGGGALHGNEMRQCWTAYEGGKMIGSDASGLEMRCLAHEMGDPDCTREITEGDIHTIIWELIPDFSGSRGNTKGIEYCLIYGGSDTKLGSLADVPGCREQFASVEKLGLRGWVQDAQGKWRHKKWNPKKESLTFKEAQDCVCGSIIRKRIMEGLKPLGDCIERITKQAEKGYLVGLDGRKLIVRSTHSALNLKLQSTGAILMKTALVRLMERLEKEGYVKLEGYEPGKYVELFTFYHDEYQFGVPESSYTDSHTFEFDLSEFDLSDKKQKKAAKGKVEDAVARWQKRQRRRTGKVWSEPHIDLKSGTAEVIYCEIGQFCVEGFEAMGKDFKLDCPITGNYMYGNNWMDTH